MTATSEHLRQWARELATHGWPVFPLRPGSTMPALHGCDRCPGTGACSSGHAGWEQRATTDPTVIDRCWGYDTSQGRLPRVAALLRLDVA